MDAFLINFFIRLLDYFKSIFMKKQLHILILIILFGCSPSKKTINHKSTLPANENRVIVTGSAVDLSSNSHDKIIFNGTNNEVIINYVNSIFKSKNSRDVFIVDGDNNSVRLRYNGIVDNSENSCDTIILKGNYKNVDFVQEYFYNNSKNSSNKEKFEIPENFIIIENSEKSNFESPDSILIENQFTNKLVSPKDLFDSYYMETIKGNLQATLYLGELYHLGIGTELNMKKAVEYYTIAAKRGNVDAQTTLGYIFENDMYGVVKNYKTAIFWYKKAANGGDEYAKERLEKLSNMQGN